MPFRCVRVAGFVLLAYVCILTAQSSQVPTFRSRATLVPLDVHVVDSGGRPITDLTESDFTVLEDGVPQHISHFLVQHLAAEQLEGPRRTPPPGPPNADGLAPQTGRVFLIVLGRGRLQDPSDGLDGLIHFVRHQLLPQDYAAVLAYNRATRFTRNHDVLAGVLERFKAKNDWLDTRIRFNFSGVQALFSTGIPSYIQSEIDAIFPPTDRVATSQTGLSSLVDKETRIAAGSVFERDARAARPQAIGFELFDQLLPEDSFDTYVANAREAMDDIEKILCGIDYLGRFSGEKHLIFVTEKGFFMPHEADGDAALARVANNARVTIDIIQTGGLAAPTGGATGWGSLAAWSPMQSIVNIAFLTGGVSSRFEFARDGLDKVDRATLTNYLIGYYPSNPSVEARYRKLEVRVNRRGATALFRHGYDSTNEPVVDRRALLTLRRVSAAGALTEDVEDINLRLDAGRATTPGDSTELAVNLVIPAAGLSWVGESGRHVVTLDVAVYCADGRQALIGEFWKRATLRLSDDTYQAALRDGLTYVARVSVKGTPKFVKAIVYDYGADVLGSRLLRLK